MEGILNHGGGCIFDYCCGTLGCAEPLHISSSRVEPLVRLRRYRRSVRQQITLNQCHWCCWHCSALEEVVCSKIKRSLYLLIISPRHLCPHKSWIKRRLITLRLEGAIKQPGLNDATSGGLPLNQPCHSKRISEKCISKKLPFKTICIYTS